MDKSRNNIQQVQPSYEELADRLALSQMLEDIADGSIPGPEASANRRNLHDILMALDAETDEVDFDENMDRLALSQMIEDLELEGEVPRKSADLTQFLDDIFSEAKRRD